MSINATPTGADVSAEETERSTGRHAVAPTQRANRREKTALSENKRAERKLGWLLCAPAALVMVLVTAYPIIYSIWLSLQRFDLRFPDEREFIGLQNYVTVLSNQFWWTAFGVTMLITVVTVAVELVLGMGLALIMHRTLVGRGIVRTAALIPYGIVTVVAAFSWKYAWTPGTGYLANLMDGSAPLTERASSLAIIMLAEIWKTTPFMALLLMAGLALVPEDLLKAASTDGATSWQRFTKVMLPVMKPAILVALLFRTLDAFRVFDNIFVLTAGSNETSSVSMLAYNNLIRGLNLGIGSTMSVLIFITVAIIAFVFVKLFGTAAPGSDDGERR
ncbi:carbohydrate ABC transporter permease [Micromonospora siamensis]|uniref:Carbohydrate ABC transporter membrane protein 1, CUT1 family n=1 Tax=Micromonospora siamensis TaxID=299152 RepID=A0A1C5JA36_9ACTN|nr:sugar ABC transporter permease [Micromonospora siamensis]SCG67121.1 carbohydrate ABC transporter membrane protein 1, CUT1 family [Micromonospora siamensis]